jgi:hypothetical protein
VAIAVPHLKPIVAPPRWAKDALWRKAQLVPSLDLNFAATKNLVDATTGAELVTFTRTSDGTATNSSGNLIVVPANMPRFDHDPVTGESLGLLVEEQRVNLLLNSETLATQSATVAAANHTLSFYGTGSVVLSGAHSATVNGTGTYPTRTTLTFTPTAGSLTLTVTGTVQYANLEAGAFATSWIPTTDAAATRAADVATITGTNFSSWYRQDEGTVFADVTVLSTTKNNQTISIDDGTSANRIELRLVGGATNIRHDMVAGGVVQHNGVIAVGSGLRRVAALGYKSADTRLQSGSTGQTFLGPTVPAVNQIRLNYASFSNGELNGTIRRLVYWGQRLPNNVLQAITQ